MEGLSWIAVIGLAVALGAALLVIRRRTDELDRVVEASAAAAERDGTGRPGGDHNGRRRRRHGSRARAAAGRRPARRRRSPDHRRERAGPRPARRRPGASRAGASWRRSSTSASRRRWTRCPSAATTTVEHRAGTAEPRTLMVAAPIACAPTDLVVVLEDVTELRRLQQIRTEFIDNLGHELRTPLSTVSCSPRPSPARRRSPTSRPGCASASR